MCVYRWVTMAPSFENLLPSPHPKPKPGFGNAFCFQHSSHILWTCLAELEVRVKGVRRARNVSSSPQSHQLLQTLSSFSRPKQLLPGSPSRIPWMYHLHTFKPYFFAVARCTKSLIPFTALLLTSSFVPSISAAKTPGSPVLVGSSRVASWDVSI
jgi:hypothetical protein